MKRFLASQLLTAGQLWHDACAVGRLVDGLWVEVPDDFPLTPAPVPASAPAALSALFTGRLVPDATQAARLAVCGACPDNRSGNCAKCQTCGGRPVAHKVRWAHETCPARKWSVSSDLII